MIIGFSTLVGSFELCQVRLAFQTLWRIADRQGIADVAQAGLAIAPGVNNFRVFALGTGLDIGL